MTIFRSPAPTENFVYLIHWITILSIFSSYSFSDPDLDSYLLKLILYKTSS